MAAPATPAEFEALIVTEADTFCDAFVKLLKLSILVWKMVKFKYTPGGALTPAYRALLCAIECPDPETI